MPESESEIELEYRLSAEQRELWRDGLPKLRGTQVEVAKRLQKVSKGKEGSWRNTVSGFLKGDEVQLRSVFGERKRAQVLADALGLSVNDLRLRLRAAREHGRELPHGWRIPGFEDLGVFPILEALHPSPLGRGSSCSEIQPPSWSLEALLAIARASVAL